MARRKMKPMAWYKPGVHCEGYREGCHMRYSKDDSPDLKRRIVLKRKDAQISRLLEKRAARRVLKNETRKMETE